jgi:HPt (histidine-containing phosphotransfer) domain-containing protein
MYVDKKIALMYLANSEEIFQKIKKSFCNSYRDADNMLHNAYKEKNYEELYRIVHSVKGISLNLGSEVLYHDSSDLCLEFKKEIYNINRIEEFIDTLNNVIIELDRL